MPHLSDYLHFFLILLPLVFALQLLTYKNAYSKPNRVLGIYMLLLSFYYFLNKVIVAEIPIITYLNAVLVLPIFLAFNPFYFLYVKSLTLENFRFKKQDYMHYIPAFALALILIILSIIPKNEENSAFFDQIYALRVPVAVAVYYLQLIVYTMLMFRQLNRHKKNLDQFFSYKEDISLNWLWLFLIIYLLFSVFDASVFFTSVFEAYHKLTYWVFMTLFVAFLGYFGTKQADIYVGKIKSRGFVPPDKKDFDSSPLEKTELPILTPPEKDEPLSRYSNSSLSEELKELILQKIIALMENDKLYTNPQLVVDDIADQIQTNKKYISQVINEKLNKNFYQFVNEYRVNHAIFCLTEQKYRNYTFEAIGDMAGFNSRSSLISSFKKVTGKTPSDFKKHHS